MKALDDSSVHQYIKRVLQPSLPSDEFHILVHDTISQLGFSDYFLGIVTVPATEISPFFSTLPDRMYEEYNSMEYYLLDFWVEWMQSADNITPFFQSDIDQYVSEAPYDSAQFSDNRQISLLYKRFQFNDRYVIPVTDQHTENNGYFSILNKGESMQSFRQRIGSHSIDLKALGEQLYRFASKIYSDKL